MNLVVTGGGTGGHIFGGIAIAQEFLSQSKANQVLFIGSAYGLETRLVPKAGLPLKTLKLGKLVGQSPTQRFITLLQIPLAVIQCIRLLRCFRADFVIGVGGYAAGPCFIAAKLLGIPAGVLEQNSVLGFTNKIAALLSKQVFTAFKEVPVGAPRRKCTYTGNPVRSQLRPGPNPIKKRNYPFVIFAFGGSQGATGINKLLTGATKHLDTFKNNIEIHHQTGEKDFEWVQKFYKKNGWENQARVYRFIDNMQEMYNRASVVLCRAGSSTIAELGATCNAPIFVPFPFAAANHQEKNARIIEKNGACIVLVQGKSTGSDLATHLIDLMNNPKRLETMRHAISEFYRPDAAKRIVESMKTQVLLRSSS